MVISIIFTLKYNNKLKKNEVYRKKRGKPRNILQKYVLKSQMHNLELWSLWCQLSTSKDNWASIYNTKNEFKIIKSW